MITGLCLSDEEIIDLAGGALAAPALDAVQTHMDSCGKCRRLLVAVSRATTKEPSVDGGGERTIDLPVGRGTEIGRHVVTGVVGAGAMGVVYAAHDPALDRQVAIKLVHQRGDQAGDVSRAALLQREAQAMARLVHANVVQVYDVGAHAGRPYIAMELVEGRTLRSWLQEIPRTNAEIV